ncbi:MAG: FHA domain-containing protein [Dehalococcoidia bacterium]|nr:FHA domain-containing protein [Dehalococcoidia bacterium]
MKKIIIPLLIACMIVSAAAVVFSPAQAQPSPPVNPDESWQPPDEGGDMVEPPVGVDTYNQTWPSLQMTVPSPPPAGAAGSIVNAYLVTSYGQTLYNLYRNDLCYLVVSFNGPGYFYLWEYYPAGSTPYGHWLCYRWYRPYAGVWRIGPFSAESWDPDGLYVWKMWYNSSFSWSERTLSFNYTRGSISPYSGPLPRPIYQPVINSFSANASSIDVGQTVTLTWTTSNAGSVTISPGIGTVGTSGSTTVTPGATTTYTLSAMGSSGSTVTSSATINVIPRVSPTLSVQQPTIQSGRSTTLSWNAPAALQVYIDGLGNFDAVGTTTVAPNQTTTYNLTSTYIDGTTQTAAVTVTVEQPFYLLYGLMALLAIAAIIIVVMMVKRPKRPQPARASATSADTATSTAATSTAGTSPASTAITDAPPAKLIMPDGGEMLLAGNVRALGRQDFEKLLPADRASFISRQHINIWYEDGKYYIEDPGSTNGTKLNGEEIRDSGRQALVEGDVIELADKLSITFKI